MQQRGVCFITEWSYVTHSRYRRMHTAVCYVRPLSYKNKRLVIAFLNHPVLGAVEQLYYRQFTRSSLLHEGLACETNADNAGLLLLGYNSHVEDTDGVDFSCFTAAIHPRRPQWKW